MNQAYRCPACGGSFQKPLHLINCSQVANMRGRDKVTADKLYADYLQHFGQPAPEQLCQIVFDSAPPEALAGEIQCRDGKWYYSTEESITTNAPVENRACPFCHSSVSLSLTAKRIRTCVMVAPAEAGKTVSLASMTNALDQKLFGCGFERGSFEDRYYASMAARLTDGYVPDPTLYLGENGSNRQPLYYLVDMDQILTAVVDQPGENLQGHYHLPYRTEVVVFMLDGEKLDALPTTDYIRIASESTGAERYLLVITKSDMLN